MFKKIKRFKLSCKELEKGNVVSITMKNVKDDELIHTLEKIVEILKKRQGVKDENKIV